MLAYDGKIMRALEVVGNYCLLNLLWILFSLPVITVFPATVAMFGVMNEWTNGTDPPMLKTFFSIFKKNFMKSCFIGLIQVLFTIIFIFDFQVFWKMEGILKIIFIPVFMLLEFIFLSMTIYLYPLMAKHEMTFKQLVRNAFFLTAARPMSPIIILMVFGIMGYICIFARFLPLVCAFSICGFVNYRLVCRTLIKVNKIAAKTN